MGLEYLVIALSFGISSGIIGRGKGSSFLIWFAVGFVFLIIGLAAVILFRSEKHEPERKCPTCNNIVKLYVQVCPRCGTDLDFPAEGEPVRYPAP